MIKPKSKTNADKEECRQWIEVTETIEQQTAKNKDDIKDIKNSIDTIKNNHLHHIEKDMEKQSKAIEKIDTRIWAVLIILVVSTVIGMVKNGL
tara:strand:+ start:292 stop:570 length:279 start_codon:yes stop_codon:yes gene_type:complete